MTTRVKATKPNIRLILDLMRDGQWAGLDYMSEVKLRGGKKNPMLGRVTKVVSGARVFVGASYQKMVERRQKEEGTFNPEEKFVPQSLPWGKYVEGGYPIIVNEKDGVENFYLSTIFDESVSPVTTYLLDGNPIAKEKIEGLPPAPSPSAEGQGGIERKIIFRTISLDSITELRAAKQTIKGPLSFY